MRMKMMPIIVAAALVVTLGAAKTPSLSLDQIPEPVRDALLAQGPAESIQSLRARIRKLSATYSAKIANEGKTYQLSVAADGTILHKELTDEDMPPAALRVENTGAAQDAIKEEAADGKVKDIHAVYDLCVTAGNKVYHVQVRGDGTILNRELDQDQTDQLATRAAATQP